MEILQIGSIGPNVELLQSILQKLGYYYGKIDGIFDEKTRIAVEYFQTNFGLKVDGIVGYNTWNRLFPYINGYTNYIIKDEDTIFNISRKFNTSVELILSANPNINVNNLSIGQRIIVPFGEVVKTDVSYTYELLQMNIRSLKIIFPFLEVGVIGKSVLNKDIPYIRIGRGRKEVFYNGAFHANEWITCPVLMKFIEDFCRSYIAGNIWQNNRLMQFINNYNNKYFNENILNEIFNNVSIYIVPMVNPDGVNLVTGAINNEDVAFKNAKKIAEDFPNIPFPSGWKANIRGVDLNLQFPAGWEQAKEIKYEQGYTKPAPRDFVGEGPLTEPEALSVYDFTLEHNFRLVIAYHTQGEEIYWNFQNFNPPMGRLIGEEFSRVSGYLLADVPYNSSFAGYKDWFIQQYNRPGYTIEAGLGNNPLPISQFDEIYERNIGILLLGAIL